MRIKFTITFLLLFATVVRAQQKIGTLAIRYFEYANEAKDKGRHRQADSLYTESLKWGEYANTYYNRAWTRESLGNHDGFCVDMATAASMGDRDAWRLHCMNCGTWTVVYRDATGMVLFDSTNYASKQYIQGSPMFQQYFYTMVDVQGDTLSDFVVYRNGDTVHYQSRTFTPARFHGGWEKFDAYMKEKLYYPKEARRSNVQGNVSMSYDVSAEGEVSNIKLVHGVEGLNEEALRFMRVLPRFEPARRNGVAVSSHCRTSIGFSLYEDTHVHWQRYAQ